MGAMSKLESFSRTIFCFILISLGGASQVQLFLFAMTQFDWSVAKKSWNLGKFYGKMECCTLWPMYIGEKGRTLGKTYGMKARCYWEHSWGTHWELREHTENLMRTWCKHVGNKGKMKKILSPSPTKLKRKIIKALRVHAEASHWLHEISIPKTVYHHFWPGLIPPL
jgi:hypothetical protein